MIHKPDSGSQTDTQAPDTARILRRLAEGGDGYFAQDDILKLHKAADQFEAQAAQFARLTAENERLEGNLAAMVKSLNYWMLTANAAEAALTERKGTDQ